MANLTAVPGQDPVDALTAGGAGAVLAVITGVEGPSYRPVGAVMALFADGTRAGTLSSGCIESDIAIHGGEALEARAPKAVRYGLGSPFIDIQLPCGGGLDILLVPEPDRDVLRDLAESREARVPKTLAVDAESGALSLRDAGETGWDGETFLIRFEPALRFLVFGKGPEAATFAGLVNSAGYPNVLLSPDPETLASGKAQGCETRQLLKQEFPPDLAVDRWTSVVLFFHDHDWEPPILKGALDTDAFYVGSQGSQRARDARHLELEAIGVARERIETLYGPVGLIPSARDAGTLAVSVLAEVLKEAMVVRA